MLNHQDLQGAILLWLQKTYVQRSDIRQKAMGLQYTEAETHELSNSLAALFQSLSIAAPKLQVNNEAMGRLILEASTGVHGAVAAQLVNAWSDMARKAEDRREALEHIAQPLVWKPKNLQDDEWIDFAMAARLADDPAYLKRVARDALGST